MSRWTRMPMPHALARQRRKKTDGSLRSATSLLAPGADPAGDAHALAAEGDVDGAAQASVGALGESASGPSGYPAPRARPTCRDGASARYFLDVFEVLGGDAAEASDPHDALEQSR